MREAACAKSLQALLVTSFLVASMSAASGELRRERVTLSVDARPREDAHSPRLEVWQEEGVLSLRVVEPGRLVVRAGAEIIAAGALGWGEDQRLRVDPLEAYPPTALPRVVNREPGREEVEVHVPAEAGAGELLTLTYEWDWKHAGKPALVRTWRLPPMEHDIPPEWLEDELSEPELEDTPEDEADALDFLSLQEAPFPVQVDPERPELLWVPGHVSREELASRLFGDASAVDSFDFEPLAAPPDAEGGPRVRVRVRHPPALLPELLAAMRGALDAQLEADVAWSRSQLTATSLDKAGAAALVERGLRWSQRSDILDGSGQSYFDRYLQALAPWRDEPPRWHLGDTLAQDWHFLGESSEPLQKAIALRSKAWKTSYSVTDGSPVLSPGDVVGRFYFPDGSSVQVHLQVLLTEERSLERAELRVRNLPRSGPRLIIPGEDGRWRGYSVEFRVAAGAPEPLEHPEGNFYWYYPGTLFIRPGDWRVGMGSGTGELAALRREILDAALAAATPDAPQPLLGLDHDVLSLLTRDERLGVFDTVLASDEPGGGRRAPARAGGAVHARPGVSRPGARAHLGRGAGEAARRRRARQGAAGTGLHPEGAGLVSPRARLTRRPAHLPPGARGRDDPPAERALRAGVHDAGGAGGVGREAGSAPGRGTRPAGRGGRGLPAHGPVLRAGAAAIPGALPLLGGGGATQPRPAPARVGARGSPWATAAHPPHDGHGAGPARLPAGHTASLGGAGPHQ